MTFVTNCLNIQHFFDYGELLEEYQCRVMLFLTFIYPTVVSSGLRIVALFKEFLILQKNGCQNY